MPRISILRRQVTGINGRIDAIVTINRRKVYVQNICAIYFRNDGTITVRMKNGKTIRGASWIGGVVAALDPGEYWWGVRALSPTEISDITASIHRDLQDW